EGASGGRLAMSAATAPGTTARRGSVRTPRRSCPPAPDRAAVRWPPPTRQLPAPAPTSPACEPPPRRRRESAAAQAIADGGPIQRGREIRAAAARDRAAHR